MPACSMCDHVRLECQWNSFLFSSCRLTASLISLLSSLVCSPFRQLRFHSVPLCVFVAARRWCVDSVGGADVDQLCIPLLTYRKSGPSRISSTLQTACYSQCYPLRLLLHFLSQCGKSNPGQENRSAAALCLSFHFAATADADAQLMRLNFLSHGPASREADTGIRHKEV